MADRAPNTGRGEPETSSEALLDGLVRALARQIAERAELVQRLADETARRLRAFA
jgi:hypothetical protein